MSKKVLLVPVDGMRPYSLQGGPFAEQLLFSRPLDHILSKNSVTAHS